MPNAQSELIESFIKASSNDGILVASKLISFAYGCSMTDERVARLRAHDSNISRYRRLLGTNLTDLERGFVERRLNEEWSAVQSLANPQISTCRFDWSGPPM
ncbi:MULTISPECIES: hypothetical protein [unclassified Bradyrhizobium]